MRVFIGLAFLTVTAIAQPPQIPTGGSGTRTILSDHPELHFAFLNSHVRLGDEIAAQKVSDRSKGEAFENNRAKSIGLSLDELKQLDKRTKDFDQSIKKIDLDTRKELDAAEKGKRKADLVALRRLEAQRYLTIVGTMYSIKADMPRASWDRLRTFVNDRFRPSVRVLEVKK